MIKIVFNFKYIYKYECVICYFFNNLSNYLYFIKKLYLILNVSIYL